MNRRSITIIFVLLLCVLFLNISCQNKGEEEDMYALRVENLGDVILVQSSACLNQSKAYTAVWEYAKVTGEDFNRAARHILGPARAEAKGQFTQNKMKIDDFLQKVEDPPEKYKPAHEKLLEMYGLYVKLHDLVLKPTAPQEEYEASVYKLYDALLKKAGELNSLLEK
ncbi:MAG: hypothetical protein KAT01_05280 [Candidatus Aminicenantes bacterium]|nr:hypothetical protein [Candidatus Aminicenantes bacterium]